MTRVRGIRGATTVEVNDREAILDATIELLREMMTANDVDAEEVACGFFTTTPDLDAAFPAEAARVGMGWENGAFLSAQEIPVSDAPERCIRVLLLVNTAISSQEIRHIYLRRAVGLRARGREDQEYPGFRSS